MDSDIDIPPFLQEVQVFLPREMTPGEGGNITQLQDAQIILYMQYRILAIFPGDLENWLAHPSRMHPLHLGTRPFPFHTAVVSITWLA